MARGLDVTIDIRSPAASTERARLDVVSGLCLGIALLVVVAALTGLFYDRTGDSYEAVTARGTAVELDGSGIYRNDSILKAGANRGSDVLSLVVGLPLLAGALLLHRRGSLRGTLVLLGALTYFLYVYSSMALGTAYNGLFLLYVALFGASLTALVLAARAIDTEHLARSITPAMPRRLPAIFMIASGFVTLVVWLMDPVAALVNGGDPDVLETGTTLVTHALDIAIIVPAAIVAGVLILQRQALGYVIAMSLLVLEVMLAPMIALQTVFQLRAGVEFTTAEIVGPIGGFVTISLLAAIVMTVILRHIEHRPHTGRVRLVASV